MVQHPIAFCSTHGFFPATTIGIGRNAQLSMIGCGTNCYVRGCDKTAEILPGTYEANGSHLNLLLDPSISPGALRHLQELVGKLQRNEITPEQAKLEAEKISPQAGKLFDIANWSDQAKATLYAAIIGAVSVVAAAKLASSPSTVVHNHPVVERVIEKHTRDFQTSTRIQLVPIPTPRPKEPR